MTAQRSAPATSGRAAHRVILVREADDQHTGSGCCGRVSGMAEVAPSVQAREFAHNRSTMHAMGAVYRALRGTFDRATLDIQVTDPRNTAWLLPAVYRDARRRGVGVLAALRTLQPATAGAAVVCDGRVLFSGATPDAEEVVDAVLDDLAGR